MSKGKARRFSRAFKVAAINRMLAGENVCALAAHRVVARNLSLILVSHPRGAVQFVSGMARFELGRANIAGDAGKDTGSVRTARHSVLTASPPHC